MSERSRFEDAVRQHSGRILAALIGQFRDFGLAEDVLQDAWLAAAERWPVDGFPDHPDAWVLTVARRTAIDRIRRERTRPQRQEAAHAQLSAADLDELERREERWHSGVDDDRLRLIFTCCHPALDLDAQIALTLRSVAWLTTDEIANAFGVATSTMAQRVVRAKAKIKAEGIPYRIPDGHELPERLAGVLRVVYLVFNEAYLSSRPNETLRLDLADEGVRLGQALAALMPDEPEVLGLLSLMMVQHARSRARFDEEGALVVLERQDRTLWDADLIENGGALLEQAMRRRSVGPYQLQAAIAALHSQARSWADTDWPQIAALYGVLTELDQSPVVAVNRAVAVGFADGADAALELLDLVDEASLPRPHHLHGARAEMLHRSERPDRAVEHYRKALELATGEAERRHLERRLDRAMHGLD